MSSVSGIDDLIRLLDDEILSIENIRELSNKAFIELTTSTRYLESSDRLEEAERIREMNWRLNEFFGHLIRLRDRSS